MSGPSDTTTQGPLLPMEIEVRPDQFDRIEEIAARTGLDRSALVRRALDRWLAGIDEDEDEAQP